ncbi:hypothetical protein ACIRD3_00950 [Kitasatospora sp. NPDC093550]|uniref:hypothetical protein n=1 Tax=Kitasatospora sp. NPDC093550 TaxID=3364089 RepID=UPI00380782EA
MGRRQIARVLVTAILLVGGALSLVAVAGWWAALAFLGLSAVAVLSLFGGRGWSWSDTRARSAAPLLTPSGAQAVGIGSITGGAVAAGAGVEPVRNRQRHLHEYAEDPLTPAAAETVADGLERLFLRLGPPSPTASGGPDDPDGPDPTPRGDHR